MKPNDDRRHEACLHLAASGAWRGPCPWGHFPCAVPDPTVPPHRFTASIRGKQNSASQAGGDISFPHLFPKDADY